MASNAEMDITFDFRSDTPEGKDPDVFSPTLRQYHQKLWSKSLPGGASFALDAITPRSYLHHKSALGEFFLASDSVIPTFTRHVRMAHIVAEVPTERREEFRRLSYTIGGMMLFPGNKIDGRMTINGARGCHPLIRDRFDLTVECIRRHYMGASSPLADVLYRYDDFFRLFGDFRGYVDFFHLQDIVSENGSGVLFATEFNEFKSPIVPRDVDEYVKYMQAAESFVRGRNARIARALTRPASARSPDT
jgi:hypothetical protein